MTRALVSSSGSASPAHSATSLHRHSRWRVRRWETGAGNVPPPALAVGQQPDGFGGPPEPLRDLGDGQQVVRFDPPDPETPSSVRSRSDKHLAPQRQYHRLCDIISRVFRYWRWSPVPAGIPSGELFPTDSPLAPADLIGRQDAVAALADQLGAHTHRIVAGPRRTGKTSVCEAALDRLRRDGAYVVAVDLFEQATLGEFAEALARQLVGNRAPARRALERLRRGGRTLAEAGATSVSARLAGELGEEVEITWRPGLAERDPDRYFDWALRALQKVAAADDRQVILFIDEFQELARERRPYGDPDGLTKRMRAVLQRSGRVTCLFAGSLEHLMRDLFTPRQTRLLPFRRFLHAPADRPAGLGGRTAGPVRRRWLHRRRRHARRTGVPR